MDVDVINPRSRYTHFPLGQLGCDLIKGEGALVTP